MGKKRIDAPKVFISYAWADEEYQRQVFALAEQLVGDGIDVVFDKWDLTEGNDTYAFMEKCVTDSTITNVLMLLDPIYAKKADKHVGGVGTETQIISAEVYQAVTQDKFIPVIMKRDENGKVCKPTYLKGRLHFDLSIPNQFDDEYLRLVKKLYGVEIYKKPEIGKRPEWVDKPSTLESRKWNREALGKTVSGGEKDGYEKRREKPDMPEPEEKSSAERKPSTFKADNAETGKIIDGKASIPTSKLFKIREKLNEAAEKYEKLCPEMKMPYCSEVENAWDTIWKEYQEGPDDREIYIQYIKLYDFYRTKTYSFKVAKNETKNLVTPISYNPFTGFILLCKNVHLLEDVINKVCTNNIDKSIIGGDQQFESMRYGFEWLFCHEDMTVASDDQANEQKHLDIRDINRYLDYIKYQIMVASKYVKKAWQTSEEIDELFEKIKQVYEDLPYQTRQHHLAIFKDETRKLIETFFDVYQLLVTYRDLRFKEEEIRKTLVYRDDSELINIQIINLSSVAVRVLLDRFVSFVKICDLNFSNSTFKRAWFNYSDLSNSNYSGSDFKYARIENARMKDCDISTCNLTLVDGGNTDFSQSNFTRSNLCGVNLSNAILDGCIFPNVAFTDINISTYKKALDTIMSTVPKGKKQYQLWITAKELYDNWQNSATLPLSPGDLINDLQEHIKGFPVDDIDTKDVQISGADNIKPVQRRIIGYNIEKQSKNKKNIYEKHKVLNKRYLSRYISKELVSYIADFENKLEGGKKAARIRDHGKVYWNAANLENAAAKDAKLGGVNLNRVNLSKASFGNSDLSGVSMYYNTAEAASFMESNLNGADCFESNYYQANFSDSFINNAHFMSCNLAYTNWNRAVLNNTVFADLSRFLIDQYKDARRDDHSQIFELVTNAPKTEETARRDDGADVLDGRFWQKSCSLSFTSMCNAFADRAIFLNICADHSSFNESSMKTSFWFNCKANLTDFIETDLRYSLLSHCDLGQSNFTRAKMTSTDISYVDFSDCNLSNVLLNKSKLEHAIFDNADTHNLNFSGAEVRNSVFSNCQLERAIVTNAKFENCIFSNVDFVDMIGFQNSKFINCRCVGCTFMDGKKIYHIDDDFYDSLQKQIYYRGFSSE